MIEHYVVIVNAALRAIKSHQTTFTKIWKKRRMHDSPLKKH